MKFLRMGGTSAGYEKDIFYLPTQYLNKLGFVGHFSQFNTLINVLYKTYIHLYHILITFLSNYTETMSLKLVLVIPLMIVIMVSKKVYRNYYLLRMYLIYLLTVIKLIRHYVLVYFNF